MKKYLKKTVPTITILFIGLNLFAQNEIASEKNFQQLQNTISNVNQSSFELKGYEGRAVQKIQEFADYIQIISNGEYDMTFREHALAMAKKMFYNEKVKIGNSDKFISSFKTMELNDYLNAFLKTGYTKIAVEIQDQQYVENLSQNKSNAYSGKLLFNQTSSYFKDNLVQNSTSEKKEVDIVLQMTEKNFGKKTKSVWNVYLGDIRVVE